MTTSSSSPSLLNDGAKNFSHSTHGKIPRSSLEHCAALILDILLSKLLSSSTTLVFHRSSELPDILTVQ